MMLRQLNKCLIPRVEYIRQFKINSKASTYPLYFKKGHIYINIDDTLWLIDTGSPTSFGNVDTISFCNKQFPVSKNFQAFNINTVSQYVGVSCVGLIGADVLNHFDIVFNTTVKKLVASIDELTIAGKNVSMSEMIGIPIIPVQIEGKEHRMIFDTGAQISYFQGYTLTQFPSAGVFEDFHLTIGNYRTETYNVPITLCGQPFTIRCGSLPDSIDAILRTASAEGIVGNEIFHNHIIGYFPRRKIMVIGG